MFFILIYTILHFLQKPHGEKNMLLDLILNKEGFN